MRTVSRRQVLASAAGTALAASAGASLVPSMMAAASPGSRPDYLSFWFEADDASLQPGDVLQLSVDGQMHKAVQGIGFAAAFAGVYAPGPKPKRSGRVRIPIAIASVVPVRASGTHAVHG